MAEDDDADDRRGSDDEPRTSADCAPAAPVQIVTFRSGYQAEIVRAQPTESLTLRTRDGHCMLAIEITDRGALLRLSGESLEISAAATLSLQAKHLALKADSAAVEIDGDLTERVRGDVHREAGGTSALTARSVGIEASPGGVTLKANDDVDVQGERVRLNCEQPPMPLTWQEFRERQRALAASDRPAGQLSASAESDPGREPESDD